MSAKKVFISYNHDDQPAAEKLKSALENRGILVTIDSVSMTAGASIQEFIEQSVRDADVTLSLVSNRSLLSAWVAMESVVAFYNESRVIIVNQPTKRQPVVFRPFHGLDLGMTTSPRVPPSAPPWALCLRPLRGLKKITFRTRSHTRESLVSDFVAMAVLLDLPEKNAQEKKLKNWKLELRKSGKQTGADICDFRGGKFDSVSAGIDS